MSKNVRRSVIIVVTCLLGLSVFFLGVGIKKDKKEPLYSYVATKEADYQVLLKENNFYDEKKLPSDKYYASKSIDKYLIKFEYDFKSKNIEEIEYRYNVTAQLVGKVSNNEQEKEIWTKNYKLIEDKKNEVNEHEFQIFENVDIDYDSYNNLAREYEENYGIAIDAVLKVKFNILYDIKIQDKNRGEVEKNINREDRGDTIELDIALTNSVSNVERNYEKETKKEEYSKNDAKMYYLISGVNIIIAVVIIIISKRKKTPEEKYKRKIKHIMKNYSELMVTVSNEPIVENYIVMKINKLEDLVDLAEQNRTNVIHYEKIKNEQNKFYVYVDKFVYVYQV